jgi:hypothetical protein
MFDFEESKINPVLKFKHWDLTLNLSLERVFNVISALDEEEDIPPEERIRHVDRFYLVLDNLLDIDDSGFDCFNYLDEMTCDEQ